MIITHWNFESIIKSACFYQKSLTIGYSCLVQRREMNIWIYWRDSRKSKFISTLCFIHSSRRFKIQYEKWDWSFLVEFFLFIFFPLSWVLLEVFMQLSYFLWSWKNVLLLFCCHLPLSCEFFFCAIQNYYFVFIKFSDFLFCR